MNTDDERRAEACVRHLAGAPPQSGAAPCPDADLVAGFVEATLPADERDVIVRHLADCDACRVVVARLDGARRDADAAPARVLGLRRIAAAAVLLVAFGSLAWMLAVREPAPTAERLVAAAEQLRARRPALFDGFEPLTAAELADGTSTVDRGGLELLRPRDALLDGRPRFAWTRVPSADVYHVRVRAQDGALLLDAEVRGNVLSWDEHAPPIPAGTAFVWRVVADGPAGEIAGSLAARVLSAAERERYESGVAEIATDAPRRLRDVLAAQWALRAGLLDEAESIIARAAADPRQQSDVERATLAHVRRRNGEARETSPR